MAEKKKDPRLARAGVTGYNKPKATPGAKKSHVVVAKEGESAAYAARRKSFQARHAKNIAKGKMSAAYWANKVKW